MKREFRHIERWRPRGFMTPRHATRFPGSSPDDGPLMLFLHGWPGISVMGRAQMEAFAPGRLRLTRSRISWWILAEFHDHLGGQSAIWIGHDWVGAQPARCRDAVLLSLAYQPDGHALCALVPLKAIA